MATSPYFTTSNQYILYDIHVDTLSQSIANNTSTIKVWVIAWRTNTGYSTYGSGYCIVNIDGEEYYDEITPSQVISYESDTVLFERTITINHDPDGKKNIYVSCYIDHSRFSSNSQGFNVNLTQIPRQANILTAPNFYDVDNPTITYSNPAGAVVTSLQACISLDNSTATIAYRDVSKTGSSYTFNLTQAERNTLLAATPNSNTKAVYFKLKTVIGGVTYYSNIQRTFTVKNANPTITGVSYQDTNAATIAITGNNQKIIQANSSITFNFTSLAALKSATLASIAVTIDGVTKSVSLSGSTASNVSLVFGTINSSNNVTAAVVLTDSRGNKTSTNVTINVLAWQLPTGIITLRRRSNYYPETDIKVNAEYASLDGNNTITIQYQYKETGAGSYGSLVTLQDDVLATITLDNTKSYNFKFIVSDRLGTTTYYKDLQIGIPILYIDRMLRSVGIGTLPNEYNMLAIDRRLQVKNTLQEVLADLWTTVTTDAARSAFLKFYDKDGNERLELTGYGNGALRFKSATGVVMAELSKSSNNGYLRLRKSNNNTLALIGVSNAGGGFVGAYDSDGNSKAEMYVSSNGGKLWLANNDNNAAVVLDNDTMGGVFGLYSKSGALRVIYGDVSNGGGRLWLLNSSNQATIQLLGHNGNITCVSLTQTSSRKVKENIKPLSIDEAFKVLELIAVSFDFINKAYGENKRGFIAEDVAEIIPELVTPETETAPASLDYIGLIPYLQTVIKDQERRIQDIESRLSDLEKKLNKM